MCKKKLTHRQHIYLKQKKVPPFPPYKYIVELMRAIAAPSSDGGFTPVVLTRVHSH